MAAVTAAAAVEGDAGCVVVAAEVVEEEVVGEEVAEMVVEVTVMMVMVET